MIENSTLARAVSSAERLQKGWGAGVFSQAYQMLRKDREDELRAEAVSRKEPEGHFALSRAALSSASRTHPLHVPRVCGQAARDAATLSLSFTKLSGGVVSLTADGRRVTSQTQLVLRKDCAQVCGAGSFAVCGVRGLCLVRLFVSMCT